jgi:RNA polymerase subunit RPABC4/transcription elongation factor Spt4
MINELQEHDVMFCFRAVLAKLVTDGWEGMFYILPVNSSNIAVESGKIYRENQ